MNEFDVSVSLYIYMHFFPLDILSLSLQTVKYFCLTSFLLVVSSLFFGSIFKFLFGLIISSLYSCVLFVYLLFIFFRRIFLLLKKKIDGGRLLSEAESKRRRGSTQTTQVPLLFDFFFKYSNDQFDDQINKWVIFFLKKKKKKKWSRGRHQRPFYPETFRWYFFLSFFAHRQAASAKMRIHISLIMLMHPECRLFWRIF